MNTSSGDTSLAIPVAKRKQSYFHKYGKTKNSTLLGYLSNTIMGCLFFGFKGYNNRQTTSWYNPVH